MYTVEVTVAAASDNAEISSLVYTVDINADTSTGFIYGGAIGEEKATFLANLTKGYPTSTWDDASINDPIEIDDTLVVTAEDTTTTITYTVKPGVGEAYLEGKVGYVLQDGDTGYVAGEYHGLIAALEDHTNKAWGCSGTTIDGTSTNLGTGQANTTAIVNGCSTSDIAADVCNDLGPGVWFLPSKDELNKFFINRVAIGGFVIVSNKYYWSSSEGSVFATHAQIQDFTSGGNASYAKTNLVNVRCARAF